MRRRECSTVRVECERGQREGQRYQYERERERMIKRLVGERGPRELKRRGSLIASECKRFGVRWDTGGFRLKLLWIAGGERYSTGRDRPIQTGTPSERTVCVCARVYTLGSSQHIGKHRQQSSLPSLAYKARCHSTSLVRPHIPTFRLSLTAPPPSYNPYPFLPPSPLPSRQRCRCSLPQAQFSLSLEREEGVSFLPLILFTVLSLSLQPIVLSLSLQPILLFLTLSYLSLSLQPSVLSLTPSVKELSLPPASIERKRRVREERAFSQSLLR